MDITWQDGSSEVNFLLGLCGYTVQITPDAALPFDAVIESAGHDEDGVIVLRYFPWNEDAGEADRSGEPKAINADDVAELVIY